MKGKKYGSALLFAAILMIQALVLVYLGAQRQGLHIDEYYSYILSNSYDTDRISNSTEVWDQWLDGDVFYDFLTVEEGEQFAYQTVYDNNAKDAHPPLFYFVLHTICSFLPGVWSLWIGTIMNILLILLTQLVLYKLSRKLMGNTLWAVVPVAIYGGMQIFADTTLYIRMYPLMTFLTILLVLQHYHLITKERKLLPVILCGVFTFLGTFTQYYFAFVAFFLAAAYCVFLFLKKKWKLLAAYASAMLLGVIAVFVIFPAGITQITGSETNNVGSEVAGNLLNFSGLFRAILSMGKQMLIGIFGGIRGCILITAIILMITAVALIILRNKQKEIEHKGEASKQLLRLALVLTGIIGFTVLFITHISGKFTYVRYLYNLFPLIALLCGMVLYLLAEQMKLNKQVLAWGVIAISLISSITIAKNQICSYMFTERTREDNAIIEQCMDKPLVVLNNGTTHQPTALLSILYSSNQVYMANYNNIESMDGILEQVDCSNGIVFLVLTDTYWSDGFDGDITMTQIIEDSKILTEYEEFGSTEFTTAYIASP